MMYSGNDSHKRLRDAYTSHLLSLHALESHVSSDCYFFNGTRPRHVDATLKMMVPWTTSCKAQGVVGHVFPFILSIPTLQRIPG
jgi:hypothetical protein